MGAVNHALVKWPRVINQIWLPVSLELKDTMVQAYRTDPVQVRSWHFLHDSCLCSNFHHSVLPMWDAEQLQDLKSLYHLTYASQNSAYGNSSAVYRTKCCSGLNNNSCLFGKEE